MTEIDRIPPETDTYYMGLAYAVRAKANCTGNRVGAVLVLRNRVISTGYNGVPAGMRNCLEGGCLRCRNPGGKYPSGTAYDLCICVHAEQNVLISAARFGIAVEGATLYTTMQPCFGCAKELKQAAIERIVYKHLWTPSDADPEMDLMKKGEHDKLMSAFDVKTLKIQDPDELWAVSTLRNAALKLDSSPTIPTTGVMDR
jgi:dCMP deaminase